MSITRSGARIERAIVGGRMLQRIGGKWGSSFYYRLVIATLVVITVMVALYSAVLQWRHVQVAEMAQRERAEHLSSLLAESLAQPLYDFNTTAVRSAARALESHSDVYSIRVTDSLGSVVVDTESAVEHSEILLTTRRRVVFNDGKHTVPVGVLELSFSRRSLQAEIYRGFVELLIGGVLVAVGAALAALWVFRTITRPLLEITQGLDMLAVGQVDITLPKVQWADEFGRMAVAVERFRDALVESKRVERSLRESEQRFRDFSSSSADWFWELDETLRFSYLSSNVQETFGCDPRDILATRQWVFPGTTDLTPPVHWIEHAARLERREPCRNFEYCLRLANGQTLWSSVSGIPFFDEEGRFLGYRGVGHNITARKNAEEGVHKLSLALEQSPSMVLITNAHGEIEYVNEAFVRQTGYNFAEVIGRNPRFLQSGQTPKEVYADLWRCLSKGESWQGEMTNRRKNGEAYVEYGIFSPLRQSDGSVTHYLSIAEDVTEKKRVEDELVRYRDNLEKMVAERTAQLAEAKEAAEAANRAKSTFVANMSHEIRTPLNAVLGLARIISRESNGGKAGVTAQRILEAGEHLLGVINDVLDFSKIEAGKLHIEQQDFNLIMSISDARNLIADQAHAKGLDIYTELTKDVPTWVRGDRLRVEQILINLLSNAVKFTHKGQIVLQARREGRFVEILVKDTGIGMSEGQLKRLFQPFEQADASTTRKYGGSGLGLVISRDIARHMGGDITIQSELDVGSEFTLRLPLEEVAPPASSAESVKEAIQPGGTYLNGVRVLAAEDMELNRIVLEDMLVQAGATVQFAEDGQQALNILQAQGAEAFDVVLTDIQMPVMDGYELARQLRLLAPGLPVLGLSARAMKEEHERCMAAGMVGQVTKPIDERELVTSILACIRQTSVAPVAPLRLSPTRVSSLIDWAALADRYKGRPGFAEKVLDIFVRTNGETGSKLREALQKGDMVALRHLAHGLRGVTGNIDAPELHSLAGYLESSIIKERTDVGEVATCLAQHVDELVQMLQERSAHLGQT